MANHWSLICYDICHPKRLARVHRLLCQHALALQYSVFMFRGSNAERKQLSSKLHKLINPKLDDLRIIPVDSSSPWLSFGRSLLPLGVFCDELLNWRHQKVPKIKE